MVYHSQINALVVERLELQDIVSSNDKSKAELSRCIKDLQDKLRDEVEIRDRELQGVRAALKKANEDKEANTGANKAQVWEANTGATKAQVWVALFRQRCSFR